MESKEKDVMQNLDKEQQGRIDEVQNLEEATGGDGDTYMNPFTMGNTFSDFYNNMTADRMTTCSHKRVRRVDGMYMCEDCGEIIGT